MANTVGEAVREASADLSAKPDSGGKSEAKTDSTSARSVETNDVEDAWDGPGWVNQWKKPSRAAMRRLAKLEGANELLPDIYKEIESRYDYTGKQQADFDKFKKRWEPYDNVVSAIEQRAALHGVPGYSALQQLVATQDLLTQNPDQGLAYLAQTFRPRDAKALLQQLAQHYGVDLSGVAKEQPWVDPAVDARVKAIEEQNRQLIGFLQGQNQQTYQQNALKVAEAIRAFKEAQDESGEPKHPHYERLEGTMVALLRATGEQDLEKLYQQALWNDPELREDLIKQRAEQANRKAVEEAARNNATAEKALAASRNVAGSASRPSKTPPADLRDLIRQESKRLSARS